MRGEPEWAVGWIRPAVSLKPGGANSRRSGLPSGRGRMSTEPLGGTSPVRRLIAVSLFVAAWMACGWLLRLDADAYLVVGVPPTILFQLIIRRRPLRALWVREAPWFH